MARLPVEQDLDDLAQWLRSTLRTSPPRRAVTGFWFGLFDRVEKRSAVMTLYVSGSERYRKGSNSMDWACDPEYWPESRYADSRVLAALSRLRRRDDFDTSWLIETCVCLPYAALAVAEICRRTDPRLLVGEAKRRGVCCGFDSGDICEVGTATARGFIPAGAA